MNITLNSRPKLSIVGILSDITCGEACWNAREDTCRCECAGRNHGCLRSKDGAQPVRACRIQGERYELFAVGYYETLTNEARKLNLAQGFRSIEKCSNEIAYHYTWGSTDDGAPGRLKAATLAQIEKWPELAAFREVRFKRPYLLWRKCAETEFHLCAGACQRCERQRAEFPPDALSNAPAALESLLADLV